MSKSDHVLTFKVEALEYALNSNQVKSRLTKLVSLEIFEDSFIPSYCLQSIRYLESILTESWLSFNLEYKYELFFWIIGPFYPSSYSRQALLIWVNLKNKKEFLLLERVEEKKASFLHFFLFFPLLLLLDCHFPGNCHSIHFLLEQIYFEESQVDVRRQFPSSMSTSWR